MRIAIIGGGLAGCALAYVLRQAGAQPVIYEASSDLASGASGNAVGLYNPRFTAERGPEQEFYATAFFTALEVFENLDGIDWTQCGALHLVTDEKKERRFPKTVESWGWGAADMRMVCAREASDIAGIGIGRHCLYLPRSGFISPEKLCAAYARDIEVHLNSDVMAVSALKADAVILAAGMGCLSFFAPDMKIPLKAVRGQVTYVAPSDESKSLQCTLGYGGYMAPVHQGMHCVGSTFQPWLFHSDVLPEDDVDNIKKMQDNVPFLASGEYEILARRAAVRTTTKDHFPVIGRVEGNVYISSGHGSHGILSSLLGAYVISDMILKQNEILSRDVYRALCPKRFFTQN